MAALSTLGISSTQPPTVKLRGSCHACALSKLKCSQDKPTCARCIKRGTACQYLASKRAGRKQGSRTGSLKSPIKKDYHSTSVEENEDRKDLLEASTQLMQYALQQDRSLGTYRGNHHHQRTPSYSESVPSLLSSAGPATSTTTPLTFGHPDFDGFLASPVSSSLLDALDVNYFAGTEVNFRDINGFPDPFSFFPSGPIPMLEDNILKYPFAGNSPSPQANPPSSPHTLETSSIGSPPQCVGFARSLALLRGLFPNPSLKCTNAATNDQNRRNAPTIQQIITQNKQAIHEISQILRCPCSQDDYTLTILALVIFKVLAWYNAVAQGSHVPGENQTTTEQVDRTPAVIGAYHLDGEDQGRMAAQLVLSELHRVQRLVSTLSLRLKDQSSRGGLLVGPNGVGGNGHESVLPFELLDRLAVDLGARLRGLSSEIVEQLRRGW